MTASYRTGIDVIGGQAVCATVNYEGDKPRIISVSSPFQPISVDQSATIRLSLPDNECMVKQLRVRGVDQKDIELKSRFELAHSLLEPAESFLFDLVSSGREDRYLGIVCRKERVEAQRNAVNLTVDNGHAVSYRIRAAALGAGYCWFCRPVGGELICLADVTESIVSICFVNRNEIAAMGHLVVSENDLVDDAGRKRLAVNLKTIVNFKLLSLSDEGVTVPLSAVLLSGSSASESLRTIIGGYFSTGAGRPEVEQSLFGGDMTSVEAVADYLVALGLTVN